MEKTEKIVLSLQKLEKVLTEYHDRIGSDEEDLRREHAIEETAAELDKVIEEKRKTDRLLNIGIIGRVKAGKSSLLNALIFDGKDILPKAATPMTASLTTLSYNEQERVLVTPFSSDDKEEIKQGWKKYDEFIDQGVKELQEQSDSSNTDPNKLRRRVEREMKDKYERLYALYNQHEEMQEGEEPSDQEISMQDLKKYVGAEEKYTPFTKSVDISLPKEELQNIRIIDTPGINDPVPSREERTMKLLSTCDVIFIVSPAGQFINDKDLGLMDRIGTKEGIRNIFVIASQIDTQLFASEQGDTVRNAVEGITTKLAGHLQSVIEGSEFDELINQSRERVVHSAALAYSMQRTFNEKWDEGCKTIWKNLREHYPKDFPEDDDATAKDNLAFLGNIKQIKAHVDIVRQKKEEILSGQLSNFINAKQKAFQDFIEGLKEKTKLHVERINTQDLDALKERNDKLAKHYDRVVDLLNIEYEDAVEEFTDKLKQELRKIVSNKFENVSIEHGTAARDRGFILFGDPTTRHYTVTTVQAGTTGRRLKKLVDDVNSEIDIKWGKMMRDWKINIPQKLVRILRSGISDDSIDPTTMRIEISHIVGKINQSAPKYEAKQHHGSVFGISGPLEDYQAKGFIENCEKFISDFELGSKKDIDRYADGLAKKLKKDDEGTLASNIFAAYRKDQDKLAQDITNKKAVLARYEKLQNELKNISK